MSCQVDNGCRPEVINQENTPFPQALQAQTLDGATSFLDACVKFNRLVEYVCTLRTYNYYSLMTILRLCVRTFFSGSGFHLVYLVHLVFSGFHLEAQTLLMVLTLEPLNRQMAWFCFYK